MTVLVIAEKRAQATSYAEAFRDCIAKNGYYEVSNSSLISGTVHITWASGHLIELCEPEEYDKKYEKWSIEDLPILPKMFKYKPISRTIKQFNVVKTLCNQASEIILACDPDREGEVIGQELVHFLGVQRKATKRLWVNSLERDAVRKGFVQLHNSADHYTDYTAGLARQQADWLVGISATRLYSKLMEQAGTKGTDTVSGTYSVGRVQTPTLFLIYQRMLEIEQFKPEPFWELSANVKTNRGSFMAKYKDRFTKREELDAFLSEHSFVRDQTATIQDIEKEQKKSLAPKLFNLSALQKRMNKLKKYSPKETLETVQSLYLKKYLSYPRTDCTYITDSEFNYLQSNLSHYQTLIPFEVKYETARKGFVENQSVLEHHAIIPTKTNITLEMIQALSDKEQAVYMEVLKRTLCMFAADHQYEETSITVNVSEVPFTKKWKIDLVLGWKAFYQNEEEDKSSIEEEDNAALPAVSAGELVFATVQDKEGQTTPPKKYTQGTLIEAMENCGKKVEDDEAREVLKQTSGIGTQATRGNIIDELVKRKYITIQKNLVHITDKGILLCEAIEKTPLAQVEMTAKWELYLEKISQKQGNREAFLQSIERFLHHLVNEAPTVINTSRVQEKVSSLRQNEGLGLCPVCKKHNIVDKNKFYGCEGYKEGCKFTISKKIAEKSITAANVKKILEKRKTSIIKGFYSAKSKKEFDAYLILDPSNKVTFEFKEKQKG